MNQSEANETLKNITFLLLQETESKNYCYKSVASKCHMSTSTFFRKIKQMTGYTPANFINYLKIQQACKIIESKDLKNLKFKEIAFKLNYTDAGYFSRVFKKYIGISPRIYRDLGQKRHFPKNISHLDNSEIKDQYI